MTKEYQRTLCDIDIILDNMETVQRDKVPQKLRELIHKNKLEGYVSSIKTNIPLEAQEIHEDTRAFLGMLYLNYWCETQAEKEALQAQFKANEDKYQEELRAKYNPDNIFKNSEKQDINDNENSAMQMVEYHESWFKKIAEKIKNFFRRS